MVMLVFPNGDGPWCNITEFQLLISVQGHARETYDILGGFGYSHGELGHYALFGLYK